MFNVAIAAAIGGIVSTMEEIAKAKPPRARSAAPANSLPMPRHNRTPFARVPDFSPDLGTLVLGYAMFGGD